MHGPNRAITHPCRRPSDGDLTLQASPRREEDRASPMAVRSMIFPLMKISAPRDAMWLSVSSSDRGHLCGFLSTCLDW